MNTKGMSNRAFLIVIICAITVFFYAKVTEFEIEDVPLSYVLIFFFVIVPLVTLAYCFLVSKGG